MKFFKLTMDRTAFRLIALGLLMVLGFGHGLLAAEPPPNLLLISVDTLRLDALGWVNQEKANTPSIDTLAREGYATANAYTPVPITLPAHASVFTSQNPLRHGVRDNGRILPSSISTLPELLQMSGYKTAAFVSGFPLKSIFGLDRGFDHYDDQMPDGVEGWVERSAEDTTREVLKWLESAPEPWFIWVHFYDPHDPYTPPRSYWRPGSRGAYDGEVSYVDAWIGRLLDSRPEQENRLTVFFADHGESLGEHEEETHGYFLYDTTVRVPMIFHWPGRIAARRDDQSAARLIDIAPTMLDLMGNSAMSEVDGRSLKPALEGQSLASVPTYLETRLPWLFFGWAPLKALVWDRWKMVVAPKPELFNLADDPTEERNLIDEERPRARRFLQTMKTLEARPSQSSRVVEDPKVLEKLKALGYVGSGTPEREAPLDRPDPKDKVRERRELLSAEQLMRAGRFPESLAAFDRVLTREKDQRYALLRSGVLLLKMGRLEEAVSRLSLAVADDPNRAEARFALADALSRSGKYRRAVEQWQECVRLQPRRLEAWANLATTYSRLKEWKNAERAYGEALVLAPDNRDLQSARDKAQYQLSPVGVD